MEGTQTRQGELTIEDGSLGNGFIDADGAQSHRVERMSGAQGVQVVGHQLTSSMVSGGIAGVGSQFGAAEDSGSGTVGAGPGPTAEDAKTFKLGKYVKGTTKILVKIKTTFQTETS